MLFPEALKTVAPLYDSFLRLPSDVVQRLAMVLDRLNNARRASSPIDRALAAEYLFLFQPNDNNPSRSEITYKLTLHAAWFLGAGSQRHEQPFVSSSQICIDADQKLSRWKNETDQRGSERRNHIECSGPHSRRRSQNNRRSIFSNMEYAGFRNYTIRRKRTLSLAMQVLLNQGHCVSSLFDLGAGS